MSTIISVKASKEDTLQVTFEMTQEEYQILKGAMHKLHIFGEENTEEVTRLVTRGKKESSKYFLAPKSHRKQLLASNNVPVQVLESKTQFHIIYSVKKFI